MKEQINTIKQNALEEILKTEDLKSLNDVKVKYLGKKGELRKTYYRKSCK